MDLRKIGNWKEKRKGGGEDEAENEKGFYAEIWFIGVDRRKKDLVEEILRREEEVGLE